MVDEVLRAVERGLFAPPDPDAPCTATLPSTYETPGCLTRRNGLAAIPSETRARARTTAKSMATPVVRPYPSPGGSMDVSELTLLSPRVCKDVYEGDESLSVA